MARWKHNAFFENLKNALGDCDYQRCSVLSNELINHLQTSVDLYDVMNARDILSALRRKRYFDLMIQVSDAFLRTGITVLKFSVSMRKLYLINPKCIRH